jgi:hypothetical protein
MMTQRLVSPLSPGVDAKPVLAPRRASLGGAVIGLLANSKANSGELLELIAGELATRHGTAGVVRVMKPHPSVPAADDALRALAEQADVVITAIGDCGSCSTCTMHDGLVLERRGIATAVLLTEPFTPAGRAIAALDGVPDYEFAILPHPTAGLTGAELGAVALTATDAVERLLLRTIE